MNGHFKPAIRNLILLSALAILAGWALLGGGGLTESAGGAERQHDGRAGPGGARRHRGEKRGCAI